MPPSVCYSTICSESRLSGNGAVAGVRLNCEDAQMRYVSIIIFLTTLASCASSQRDSHSALMDEIESAIQLPPEAEPLESYARYYSEYKGSVRGAYTTQVEPPRPSDYGCEEVQSDGSLKTVDCPAPADARPGERRWVKFDDYPAVAGENCTAIQLEYDLRTRKITYLECARPYY